MNNVDLFIKYLSGDMNPVEASSFEKDLDSNPVLKKAYNEVADAYQLISEELQRQDEALFKAKLQEIIETRSNREREKPTSPGPRWYILLPLAATFAILLAIYLSTPSDTRLLSRYYKPHSDPVLMAFDQGTRGISEQGIYLFNNGNYRESMEEMIQLLEREPGNEVALLFYLLASMELDLQDSALDRVTGMAFDSTHKLGQSLTWYTSMGLLKAGQKKEAEALLGTLTLQPGPYRKDARRLQKMLLK